MVGWLGAMSSEYTRFIRSELVSASLVRFKIANHVGMGMTCLPRL